MFFLKKPFAHVGIYPLTIMLFLTFVHNHFYIAKKKWKINACAKIISGTKVNVIYSVMYAIRNFLNGNDNWYNLKKITYIFTPFLQILWDVKKKPWIYTYFLTSFGWIYVQKIQSKTEWDLHASLQIQFCSLY